MTHIFLTINSITQSRYHSNQGPWTLQTFKAWGKYHMIHIFDIYNSKKKKSIWYTKYFFFSRNFFTSLHTSLLYVTVIFQLKLLGLLYSHNSQVMWIFFYSIIYEFQEIMFNWTYLDVISRKYIKIYIHLPVNYWLMYVYKLYIIILF